MEISVLLGNVFLPVSNGKFSILLRKGAQAKRLPKTKERPTERKKKHGRIVIATGVEPVTRSLEGCCSIQLSYATIICRCKGIKKTLFTKKENRLSPKILPAHFVAIHDFLH